MCGGRTLRCFKKARRLAPRSEQPCGENPNRDNAGGPLNMDAVSVRDYRPGDAEQVLAICWDSPESAQWSRESYDRGSSNGENVFVAEAEGHVLGFLVARVIGAEAEILNMAVDPARRREGTGSKLISAAFAEAQRRSVERIFLEVRESNHAAIVFYERHGFSRTGKRTAYYRDPVENAVLMERKITG